MTAKAVAPSAKAKAAAAFLGERPGAEPLKYGPNVFGYKVGGKVFAIHSLPGGYVVLKCDPHLIDMLKQKYKGIGHKTHLDRRYWIAVETDTDVPPAEFRKLAALSYDLVREAATPKKKKTIKKKA